MAGQDELVRAASEARAHATQALESLTNAHTACDQKAAAIAALPARIAADREALAEAMEALGLATGDAAGKLALAVAKAAAALAHVGAVANGLADVGPRMLHFEAADLDHATAELHKVEEAIGKALEAVEASNHETFEVTGAGAHQLEEDAEKAESILRSDPLAVLEHARPELAELVAQAVKLVKYEIPEALTTREAEWEKRRETILAGASETLDGMRHHAEEVTVHVATTLGSMLGAERDAREAEAATLAGELTTLAHSLDARRLELEGSVGALVERLHAEQTELHTLSGELEAVRGRWATFGFTV